METHSALLFCRHFLCRLPNAGLWGLFFPGAWSSNSPLQIKSSMPALPYEHYGCVYCGGHDRFRRLKLRLKLFLCILFLCILGGCGVTSHQPLPSHWGQGWDKRLPMENWHLATRKPIPPLQAGIHTKPCVKYHSTKGAQTQKKKHKTQLRTRYAPNKGGKQKTLFFACDLWSDLLLP